MSDPIDIHIGAQMRIARIISGKTQTDVADCLGVTFQQVRKYENGVNRISASALYKVSGQLSVRPEFFFQGLDSAKELDTKKIYSDALKIIGLFSTNKNKEIRSGLERAIAEINE